MNFPHPTVPRLPGSLKSATVALITACGGLEEAAALVVALGVRKSMSSSQMHRYGAPESTKDGADTFMPSDIVAALEGHCRQPIVSSYTAMRSGHVLISTGNTDETPLGQDLAKVGQEMALLFAEVGTALGDGKIQPCEAARIVERCFGGVGALASVIAEMRIIQKGAAA